MSCEEAHVADIRALDDGADDEKSFALVARLSRILGRCLRIDSASLRQGAGFAGPRGRIGMVASAPRAALPAIGQESGDGADRDFGRDGAQRAQARGVRPTPSCKSEALVAGLIEQTLKFWSDVGAAAKELMFISLYANPFLMRMNEGYTPETDAKLGETLRELPRGRGRARENRTGWLRRGGRPHADPDGPLARRGAPKQA